MDNVALHAGRYLLQGFSMKGAQNYTRACALDQLDSVIDARGSPGLQQPGSHRSGAA
jgi:hypothetical protein